MNSANPQEIQHSPDSQLNAAQVRWLNEQVIPCPLYLKSATEFDDTYLNSCSE